MSQLRVVLIDDSQTARKSIEQLLRQHHFIDVVATFGDPALALQELNHLKPDLLLVDLLMPAIDGFEFLRRVKLISKAPVIIFSAFYTKEDKVKAARAFELGALEILEKPVGVDQHAKKVSEELIYILRSLCGEQTEEIGKVIQKNAKKNESEVIIIGTSTGGPLTLNSIFSALPSDFPLPIVVVQHLAEGFLEGLVGWLQKSSNLPLEIAVDKQSLRPGVVYFAPVGHHLTLTKQMRFSLIEEEAKKIICPAFGKLVQSCEKNLPTKTTALILSGMGSDGAIEMRALQEAGGFTIAQSSDNCILFGMPKAAIDMGGIDLVLPLSEIPNKLVEIASWKKSHIQ